MLVSFLLLKYVDWTTIKWIISGFIDHFGIIDQNKKKQ
jgi:hypothetical protein